MKKFLKYTGITIGVVLIGLYLLFLAAPIFLNGIANSYSSEITKIFEDATGFKLKLGEIKILTTPKLTAGGIVEHIELALPTGEAFFTADNVQAKLSLFPIFAKRIEIDMAGADNINVNLKIKKDGKRSFIKRRRYAQSSAYLLFCKRNSFILPVSPARWNFVRSVLRGAEAFRSGPGSSGFPAHNIRFCQAAAGPGAPWSEEVMCRRKWAGHQNR